jgi:hypothetical protein
MTLPLLALLCTLSPTADHLESGLALVDLPSLPLNVGYVVGHMVRHLQMQLWQLGAECLPHPLR